MSPQDRRTLRVGVVGFMVAVMLILGAWRVVSSDLPDFRAAAAVPPATPSSEPTVARSPSETFVVPSPPPITQTPTESPTSAPEPAAAAQEPAAAQPVAEAPSPSAARNGQPPRNQPGSSAPLVRNVDLSCSQQGKRVAASLTFHSDGPVAISLTAGGRTETSRGSGAVRMHVSGPGGQGSQCSAVVDGGQVGPIPGGGRR